MSVIHTTELADAAATSRETLMSLILMNILLMGMGNNCVYKEVVRIEIAG